VIDRRAVNAMLAATILVPVSGRAQEPRIGYLHPITVDPGHITYSILSREWRRRGYVDGRTVLARSANRDLTRLPGLVRELLAEDVKVLLVVAADALRAAAQATTTTPIVAIDMETDPLEAGLVASYGRPGGNVTGLFLDQPSLATKWIELVQEAVPDLTRIVLAWQPSMGREQLDVALAAARRRGLEPVVLQIDTTDDFEARFASIAAPRSAVIQLTFPGFTLVAPRFAAAAHRHGIPTISFLRAAAQNGILMSYGPNQEDYWPRAIDIVDRIIQGERPAEIPIERPTRFEFCLNLKAARDLGLTLPPTLVARADELFD
jgi:putative ABC transport system substrate-binding protein